MTRGIPRYDFGQFAKSLEAFNEQLDISIQQNAKTAEGLHKAAKRCTPFKAQKLLLSGRPLESPKAAIGSIKFIGCEPERASRMISKHPVLLSDEVNGRPRRPIVSPKSGTILLKAWPIFSHQTEQRRIAARLSCSAQVLARYVQQGEPRVSGRPTNYKLKGKFK